MTTLICSGTLFSNWHDILKTFMSTGSSRLSIHTEISALAREICQQQFSESDELDWRSFSPDMKYTGKASQLLSSIENEPLFTWADRNSSLFLNFWKDTAEDAKFVLFYSSPEFELSNYIDTHPFKTSGVEKIIEAWIIRTQAMLTFFMNSRERSLLVSVQTANHANGLFIQALNQQFDLDLKASSADSSSLNESSALIEYLATTLLLKNQHVSELYDEVRSAATLTSDRDKSISGIEDRNKSLISAFLNEVYAFKQLGDLQAGLEDELSISQLQINQMAEELEFYFKKSSEQKEKIVRQRKRIAVKDKRIVEQEKITNTMADYLNHDPLLKIARQVRQMP